MRTPKLARAAVSAALLVCAQGGIGTVAHAQAAGTKEAADEAGSRFRRGVELFKEADFRAALIEFRRAYQLAPNYRVQYNLGQCYLELQDYAGALRSFERYLSEGGSQVPAARRTSVEGEIQKLQPRVARIEITTNVPGAEIRIDDDVVGTTPLAQAVLVSAGRRKISAEKSGAPTTSKTIDVAGGDKITVALQINEAGAPTPPQTVVTPTNPSEAPRPAPPESPKKTEEGGKSVPWIGWGITGALAVGAGVTGVLALGAKNDLKTKEDTFPGNASDIDDARGKVKTFALVTDILAGGAVVAGGISLYFTLAGGKKDSAALPANLRVGFGPSRIQLDGRF
jgi:hypothetical protein